MVETKICDNFRKLPKSCSQWLLETILCFLQLVNTALILPLRNKPSWLLHIYFFKEVTIEKGILYTTFLPFQQLLYFYLFIYFTILHIGGLSWIKILNIHEVHAACFKKYGPGILYGSIYSNFTKVWAL